MINYGMIVNDERKLSKILNMPMNGYHSIQHALAVSQFCQELAVASNYDTLTLNSLRYAGLFHDAGHTRMAHNPDHRNISKSLQIWNKFEYTHNLEEEYDNDLINDLILCTHSGLSGDYIEQNYSETEKIIYDADTLAGTLVLDIPGGVDQMMQDLHDEGYVNAGNPVAFVKYRGLYSAAAKDKYSKFLNN